MSRQRPAPSVAGDGPRDRPGRLIRADGLTGATDMRLHRRAATFFDRRPTPIALLAIAVLTILTACAPAGPRTQAAPAALHWTACGGGRQCSRATLPLDYDHPERATVSVAVIRLPASNPRQRIGSVLINPGGPGGSGVAKVRNGAAQVFPRAVLARFDIVGFDPRGVGQSSPIRCFASPARQAEFFAGMPVYPAFPVGPPEQATFAGKMKE